MIGMGMGNQGAFDRAPGIDIGISSRTVQSFGAQLNQRF
jgi:hypothetical protein